MTKAVNGTGETRTPVTAIKSRVPYHLGHSPKSRCVKINQIKLSDIIYNICCPHLINLLITIIIKTHVISGSEY